MVLDVHAVLSMPLFVFGIAAMLVVTKAAIIFGLACLFGLEKKQAFSLGLLLSQGGEFAFVLFHQAQGALLIAPSAASLLSAIVTISLATTPFLLWLPQTLEFARPSMDKTLYGPDHAPQCAQLRSGERRVGKEIDSKCR